MTIAEQIITIAMCTLGTMAMRFLPFLVFRQDKPTPKYIQYLGKVLPGAIFGMLIVYCLRSVSVTEYSWGLPELIAGAATVGIHLVEAQHAAVHRRRDGYLHAAGAVRVCIM